MWGYQKAQLGRVLGGGSRRPERSRIGSGSSAATQESRTAWVQQEQGARQHQRAGWLPGNTIRQQQKRCQGKGDSTAQLNGESWRPGSTEGQKGPQTERTGSFLNCSHSAHFNNT